MIGDTLLFLKEKWKQCFCLHDYQEYFVNAVVPKYYRKCRKCGRVK